MAEANRSDGTKLPAAFPFSRNLGLQSLAVLCFLCAGLQNFPEITKLTVTSESPLTFLVASLKGWRTWHKSRHIFSSSTESISSELRRVRLLKITNATSSASATNEFSISKHEFHRVFTF
ncbi:uncharacterized protein LOC132794939 [Drosophila nasuta]|uniref:uncharacterized protein LOC132794939 n=1 Tax=Drosophila nasuta TaxID=42062 RepID=UPI00295E3048|nr:uncharacterized protein LOC132794939 [Drosophila nasuta]